VASGDMAGDESASDSGGAPPSSSLELASSSVCPANGPPEIRTRCLSRRCSDALWCCSGRGPADGTSTGADALRSVARASASAPLPAAPLCTQGSGSTAGAEPRSAAVLRSRIRCSLPANHDGVLLAPLWLLLSLLLALPPDAGRPEAEGGEHPICRGWPAARIAIRLRRGGRAGTHVAVPERGRPGASAAAVLRRRIAVRCCGKERVRLPGQVSPRTVVRLLGIRRLEPVLHPQGRDACSSTEHALLSGKRGMSYMVAPHANVDTTRPAG